jgi:hypothetical protein
MKAVVVYESMFGSTREVAHAIAEGLSTAASVSVVNVNQAEPAALTGIDLLVVGAPTHVHGLSRPESRAEAVEWTKDESGRNLRLEPEAPGIGIREWLPAIDPAVTGSFAAFDTRADFPRLLSGAASHAIDKALRKHGLRHVTPPASFLVTAGGHVGPGELDRARVWGEEVARTVGEQG